MSDTEQARGTVPSNTVSVGLRRMLLKNDASRVAPLRDQLCIARALCQTEAAYISIFADAKEVLVARAGALPREIPYRASQLHSLLSKTPSYECLDLLGDQDPTLSALLESPWYYRYGASLPLTIGGVLVGALAVLDRTPRQSPLSEAGWTALRALARVVSHILSIEDRRDAVTENPSVRLDDPSQKRQAARVHFSDIDRPAAADREGLVGFFEIDVPGGTARISPSLCRMLALPMQDIFPVSAIKPCLPRIASRRSFLEEISLENEAVLDYRIRLGGVVTERPKWLQCQIGVTRSEGGHVTHAFGVVSDASHYGETVRHYTLLALLGKELRNVNCAEDASRIASRYLGMTLSADHVRCFYFGGEEGDHITEFDGWSRDSMAPSAIVRPVGRKVRGYLAHGMSLAIDDVPSSGWLLTERAEAGEGHPQSCLIVPSLTADRLQHCVVIQSVQKRVWRVEDTHFARIVVDWVDAVSDLMEARRGQEFLYREMAHRLKNTLTVVQALARQSLKDYPDQTGVKSFERRVHALASANVSSMSRRSKKAVLQDIAEDVLRLIAPLDRFVFEGPKVSLGPKTAGYLGLLLNELGTNAIKYGALCNEKGKVFLSWGVDAGEDAQLELRWVEVGGPRVKPPLRQGFGTQMIYFGLGEGCFSEVTFDPAGCQARFQFSLAKASQD